MKKLLLFIVCTLSFCLVSCSFVHDRKLSAYLSREDYSEGISYCQKEGVHSSQDLYYMGQFSYGLGKKETAYRYLKSAFLLSSATACLPLAYLARDRGEQSLVLAVVSHLPEVNEEGRMLQFQAYSILGDKEKAQEILTTYLKGNMPAYTYLSMLVQGGGNASEVKDLLLKGKFTQEQLNKILKQLYDRHYLNEGYIDYLQSLLDDTSIDSIIRSNVASYQASIYTDMGSRVMARRYNAEALRLNPTNGLSKDKL